MLQPRSILTGFPIVQISRGGTDAVHRTSLRADVSGEAYRRLIDYAISRSAAFVVRGKHDQGSPHAGVFRRLKPFLLEICSFGVLVGRNQFAYTDAEGDYCFYKCCPESGEVLKEVSESLFSWQHPHLPEDLSFVDMEGNDFLVNIAHEKIGYIQIGESEAEALADQIPGLFFRLESHKDFDRFLDDAIRHQTEELHITGFGLKELPDRIRQLQRLKVLEIFEQDVSSLPPGLFELTTLESLSVLTADLESIPKEIGKLVNLRSLRIGCGSYDRPTREPRTIIPKEQLRLTSLPPEIGQLQKLELLHIEYTGVRELPEEIGRLTQLRALIAPNNMLEKYPEFVSFMRGLEYVDLNKNPYDE
jgi:hypothetical protein